MIKRNLVFGTILSVRRLQLAYKYLAPPFLIITLGFAPFVAAKEVRYKDYPLELRESDQVVFQFMRGSLKIVGAANAEAPAVLRAKKVVRDSASENELAEFENF